MKKICFLILFVACTFRMRAELEVYFMYSKFNSPNGGYVETTMSTIGNSTIFVQKPNGKFQSEIEVLMTFKIADSIVSFDKYILRSPEISDTNSTKPNFIDIQRINLKNGTYNFELSIKDINSPQNPYLYKDSLYMDFNDNLQISDIQLIESYKKSEKESLLTKSGFDMVPYVANYFPENMKSLKFYMEIYNSDKKLNDDFVLKYYIENYSDTSEVANCSRYKKLHSASIIPFIGELSIENLPSGNYYLVNEIINRENKSTVKIKYFFQRQNEISRSNEELTERARQFDIKNTFAGNLFSRDSIIGYIKSMRPIASVNECPFIDNQLKKADLKTLQNYFVEFWVRRDFVNPEARWYEYKSQVELVEKNYATSIRHGYETDRGITYLHYGMPNRIYTSPLESGAYPYEIWQYYRIENENNCKFVFYNPSMAGKDYELLHSNKEGELQTYNWTRYLTRSKSSSYGVSDTYNSVDNSVSSKTLNNGTETGTFNNNWENRALEEFNR